MNWMAKVFIVINLIFCLVSNASATIINLPGSIFITDENLVHQVFNQEKILNPALTKNETSYLYNLKKDKQQPDNIAGAINFDSKALFFTIIAVMLYCANKILNLKPLRKYH